MIAVLFVCLGNICRSPAGEAVLARLAAAQGIELQVESCGLGDWHQGQRADPRMRKAASARGLDLESVAFAFEPKFFDRYDYILAADHAVVTELHLRARTPEEKQRVELITTHSSHYRGQDIPDPYHGTAEDFEHALDMLEESCAGFLASLSKST